MATAYSSLPTTPRSAGPSTPRRALLAQSNLATPSRPFIPMAPHAFPIPSLPALSTRAYPAEPYARDLEFAQVRASDLATIDYTVNHMRTATAARRRAMAGVLAEIEEEKRRTEEQAKNLGEVARSVFRSVKKEREEEETGKEREKEARGRQRELAAELETVRADVAEQEMELKARRALKQKEREAFHRQTSKNGPEIAFFEEKLGLKIRGRGQDIVQFKFSNIDSSAYSRIFSFDLDASQSTYTLPSIAPPGFLPLAVLSPLVDRLNTSRDLYEFVRSMRDAFKDESKIGRLGLGDEGSKDVERQRLRAERERR